jgi:hypothetical protein
MIQSKSEEENKLDEMMMGENGKMEIKLTLTVPPVGYLRQAMMKSTSPWLYWTLSSPSPDRTWTLLLFSFLGGMVG